MSETKTLKRTIILPPSATRAEILPPSGQFELSVDTLLNDALGILQTEIVNLKSRTGVGKSLDAADARILTGYLKELNSMKREQREAQDAEDLSKMTDEEILQLVEQVQAARRLKAGGSSEPKS